MVSAHLLMSQAAVFLANALAGLRSYTFILVDVYVILGKTRQYLNSETYELWKQGQ